MKNIPKLSGGQKHEKFIEEALGRSSPGSARLLAELFGGFELGLEYSDSQAIITVGGAATRCQHQSPWFVHFQTIQFRLCHLFYFFLVLIVFYGSNVCFSGKSFI